MSNITYRMADFSKLDNLPDEIKQRKAWCLAGASKAPITIRDGEPYAGDVGDPSTFLTYDVAKRFASCWDDVETFFVDSTGEAIQQTGYNVGFVLTEDDPFAVIDLDDHGDLTDEDKQRHDDIVNTFTSYTEKSSSGKGLHVWLKSSLTANVRRDHVECYTSNRFIICTGNDINVSKTIENRDDIFANMIEQMRSDGQGDTPYISRPAIKSDEWVLERCEKAATGVKFQALWAGDMSGYPSQSEADLALLTYLGFFTPDDEQVYRLFLQSALGQREKAHSEYHRNKALHKMRQNSSQYDAPSLIDNRQDFTDVLRRLALIDENGELPDNPNAAYVPPAPTEPADIGELIADMQVEEEEEEDPLLAAGFENEEGLTLKDFPEYHQHFSKLKPIDFPDNKLGRLAEYVYNKSRVPLKEVSLCVALASVAGIAGNTWLVDDKGLNIYILLVAESMSGKDMLHKGTNIIFDELSLSDASARDFVTKDRIVSSNALIKALIERKAFVHLHGELGKMLEAMSAAKPATQLHSLRSDFLEIFTAGDLGGSIGGLVYSKKVDNTEGYNGRVSYSVVGETTPLAFDNLKSDIFTDGFMGRFLVIEYRGVSKMPRMGRLPNNPLPVELQRQFTSMLNTANNLKEMMRYHPSLEPYQVAYAPRVRDVTLRYNAMFHCVRNSVNSVVKKQSVGRAMEKIIKIAALQAVFENPDNPVIDFEMWFFAVDLVCHDILDMFRREDMGELGSDDSTRLNRIKSVIDEYRKQKPKPSYRVNSKLWKNGIVERSYLMKRCYSFSCFKTAGSMSNAFEAALRDMIKNGALIEQNQSEIKANYNVNAICYKLGDKI